jgi:hypothetical protein
MFTGSDPLWIDIHTTEMNTKCATCLETSTAKYNNNNFYCVYIIFNYVRNVYFNQKFFINCTVVPFILNYINKKDTID